MNKDYSSQKVASLSLKVSKAFHVRWVKDGCPDTVGGYWMVLVTPEAQMQQNTILKSEQ